MMTKSEQFLREGRLRPHRTSAAEIRDLLAVGDRDLKDSSVEAISIDLRFQTAYQAALQFATIVLAASGFRVVPGQGHHWVTFAVLPELFREEGITELANYFDDCRTKRNVTGYDSVGGISKDEVKELHEETQNFRRRLMAWLRKKHARLVPR